MRFFPHWSPLDGGQVSGLIKMVMDIHSARPGDLEWVEIGSWIGESALLVSSFPFVRKMWCVDHTLNGEMMASFNERLRRPIASGVVEYVRMNSVDFSRVFPDRGCDVVYIDANHDYEGVSSDILHWWPKVRPGGFVCGHDLCGKHPGVVRAVEELCSREGVEFRKYDDMSWLVARP